jgi:hypothetical protein
MEIKHGAYRTEILPDGSRKHIYLQSIDSTPFMAEAFFKECKEDVTEFCNSGEVCEVLILNTGEPLTDADNGDLLIDFQTYCEKLNVKLTIVLTSEANQYKDTYLKPIKNIFDLNLQLLCYDNMKKLFSQASNDNAVAGTGILHLTGKPNKVQRIGVLYQCYLEGLNNNFKSSAWLPAQKNTWVDQILKISDKQYEDFLANTNVNSVDGIQARTNADLSNLHYLGLPYDQSIYEKTFCSLINETWIHEPIHITEKTWRTIDNLHPFVLMGSPGSIRYLESAGINCFREYMSYPDYDDFKREHTSSFDELQPWFKQIIRNCMDLNNLTAEQKANVMQVAVKNKQILQELINKNKNTLSKFYNLDPDRLFDKSIVYC